MQIIKASIRTIIVIVFFAIASYITFPMQAAQADVILHAFDWSYQDIADNADAIADAGYKAVLVTPPLKSPKKGGCEWYLRYQPQDFRVIDNCDGNKESFVNAIKALDANGVRTYADVVVNHMANERQAATTFPGDRTLKEYDNNKDYWAKQILYGDSNGNGVLDNGILPDDGKNDGLFDSSDFHSAKCISDYNDRNAVIFDRICGGNGDTGLPDLKDSVPDNNWVNDQRKQYIQALYDLGVRGFRIDAAKHMPMGAIQYFVPDAVANDSQIFAEIITSGGTTASDYQLFLNPYLSQLPEQFGAYDFPLLNALKNAFAFGQPLSDIANPYATGNALENSRAVTVVVTHDIPYNDGFRYLIFDESADNSKDEDLAYAYIMGRDGGTPLVFDDRSTGLPKYGGPSNNERWVGVWKQDMMKNMIDFHNRMQGKPMDVLAADECALLWRRGEDGIVGINKCGDERSFTVDTSFKLKWDHPYTDILTGNPLPEIQGPEYTFKLPARSASMWYAE
ncbi:alpha-amylase family glycosyl hydrolase [Leptothoe kymatousa]|uniref:Alpha-amylase n=1 Tax=Leptothoe kymatousa TAU-MAC 1615 TaxID=2364775 RepID=A0ABS5XYD8_9CYAN|nr:alpha-amylase family glycosyl hydrolase [Leptothoe kymatousa]MBT9310655.1 alpha-amylase [Leptothoe kymatousa TAU-MAC 1615]